MPRRQTEYPARDLVSEETLHARRESLFLVLCTVCLVAIALTVAGGVARTIDLSAAIERAFPTVELLVPLLVPFGVLPGVLGLIAIALACELYGRRRAGMLVSAGLLVAAALVGLAAASAALDGDDAALGPAVALAAYVAVGHVTTLFLLDVLGRGMAARHGIVRLVLASLVAQPLAWAAFAVVMYAQSAQTQADLEACTLAALGPAVYTIACVIVLAPLFALAARTLAVFMRVTRFAAGPAPEIVAADEPVVPLVMRRTMPSFSHAELEFFAEGERA